MLVCTPCLPQGLEQTAKTQFPVSLALGRQGTGLATWTVPSKDMLKATGLILPVHSLDRLQSMSCPLWPEQPNKNQ